MELDFLLRNPLRKIQHFIGNFTLKALSLWFLVSNFLSFRSQTSAVRVREELFSLVGQVTISVIRIFRRTMGGIWAPRRFFWRRGAVLVSGTWKINVPGRCWQPNAWLVLGGSGKCIDKCQIFIENKQNRLTNKQTNKQGDGETTEMDGNGAGALASCVNRFPRKEIKWRSEQHGHQTDQNWRRLVMHRCSAALAKSREPVGTERAETGRTHGWLDGSLGFLWGRSVGASRAAERTHAPSATARCLLLQVATGFSRRVRVASSPRSRIHVRHVWGSVRVVSYKNIYPRPVWLLIAMMMFMLLRGTMWSMTPLGYASNAWFGIEDW